MRSNGGWTVAGKTPIFAFLHAHMAFLMDFKDFVSAAVNCKILLKAIERRIRYVSDSIRISLESLETRTLKRPKRNDQLDMITGYSFTSISFIFLSITRCVAPGKWFPSPSFRHSYLLSACSYQFSWYASSLQNLFLVYFSLNENSA